MITTAAGSEATKSIDSHRAELGRTYFGHAKSAHGSEHRPLTDLWQPRPGSVAHTLAEKPSTFDFFQAVLLLERIAVRTDATTPLDSDSKAPLGEFHHCRSEAVRLLAPATTAFPTAQIDSLDIDPFGQPRLTVNFMGLTGPSGILPRVYTDAMARVGRDGRGDERHALRDFLDQFNHRLISLFFAAWTKYRFPVRLLRSHEPVTLVEVALGSVGGLNLQPSGVNAAATEENTATNPTLNREQLLGFAGLLTQHPSTAGNLEAVLRQLLGVPIQVLQFQPSVLELDEESQCCLGIDNGCGELGVNTVVGPRTRTRQHKIRIELGPLDYETFLTFLPDDQTNIGFQQVDHVVRTFAGYAIEYDLRLEVQSATVPGCRLESFDGEITSGARLSFDSWLQSDDWPEILSDAIV